MKSLRTRLLIGMIGSLAVLLIVFGLILDASIEFMMVREFDFYLETLRNTGQRTARSWPSRPTSKTPSYRGRPSSPARFRFSLLSSRTGGTPGPRPLGSQYHRARGPLPTYPRKRQP